MSYTKEDLFNDINRCIERYVEQELLNRLPPDDDGFEIVVVTDSEGDDVDPMSGDIWNLETQTIVGRKDIRTGEKIWFEQAEQAEQAVPADVEGAEELEDKKGE